MLLSGRVVIILTAGAGAKKSLCQDGLFLAFADEPANDSAKARGSACHIWFSWISALRCSSWDPVCRRPSSTRSSHCSRQGRELLGVARHGLFPSGFLGAWHGGGGADLLDGLTLVLAALCGISLQIGTLADFCRQPFAALSAMPAGLESLSRHCGRLREAHKRGREPPEPEGNDSDDDDQSDDDEVEVDELGETDNEEDERGGEEHYGDDDENEEDEEQDEEDEEEIDEEGDDEYAQDLLGRDVGGLDEDELRELVGLLKTKIISLQQSGRASNTRKDHSRPTRTTNQTDAQFQQALRKHEQRAALFFRLELQKRSSCRASVVNRLLHDLDDEERVQIRSLGFIQQEWYA